jgi:prepilin-type N-terminal cleavage/methylation domain-containing protein
MEKLIGQQQPDSGQGFSLIEMLIAIAILSVAIIGIVALFPTGYSHIKSAGRISMMNHLGQQKLDQLRNMDFQDANLTAGTHPTGGESFPERPSYIAADGTDIYDDYSITWEVRDSAEGETDMKTIIVTVGHQLHDSGGTEVDEEDVMHQQKVQFQTYISD